MTRHFASACREDIGTVVIGKTPGHQSALELHGRIASIFAAMETARMLEAKFRAMVDRDVLALARQVSGELSTEAEKNKLLAGRVEELECKLAKGGILEVFGCGGLIARRLAQRPR